MSWDASVEAFSKKRREAELIKHLDENMVTLTDWEPKGKDFAPSETRGQHGQSKVQ